MSSELLLPSITLPTVVEDDKAASGGGGSGSGSGSGNQETISVEVVESIDPSDKPASEDEEPSEDSVRPKWSDALKTPRISGTDTFSPARELSKPGSIHGLGLLLATDRSKKLTRSGRQCATLIYDIGALHEAFAQSIDKAANQLPLKDHPVAGLTLTVHKSLVSFSKQVQGLAICWRGSVARPLHASLQSLNDTAPSIFNRYSQSRQRCCAARQAALKMRLRYVKAVRDADHAIQEFKSAKKAADEKVAAASTPTETTEETDESTSTATTSAPLAPTSANKVTEGPTTTHGAKPVTANGAASSKPSTTSSSPSWEQELRLWGRQYGIQGTADRVISCLTDVRHYEAQYVALVQEENVAVKQAETLEMMGLESTQHLEEERLNFFVESISRTVQAEKGALDKMAFSMEIRDGDEGEGADHSVSTPEKKNERHEFFRNLLKSASHSDYSIGVMEAETLGLPEDVGRLRDKVKAAMRERESRTIAVKAVGMCLEEMANASSMLALGIFNRLAQDGYGAAKAKSNEPLAMIMNEKEGPRINTYWKNLIGSMSSCADSVKTLGTGIRTIRCTKFDSFLSRADKELKSIADLDDQRWKQLCDAARAEAKAQNRYQQTMGQIEKARERVQSVGEVDEESSNVVNNRARTQSAPKINAGATKALGKVFAILPKGGERAMDLMGEDARRAITKAKLNEADQRGTKDKASLAAAKEAKKSSLQSYESIAQETVEAMRKADDEGWDDITKTLEDIIMRCRQFQTARCNALQPLTTGAPDDIDLVKDVAGWTRHAKKQMTSRAEQVEKGSTGEKKANSEYLLPVELANSKQVYKLLNFVGDDETELDLNDDDEEADSKALEIQDPMVADESALADDSGSDSNAQHQRLNKGTSGLKSITELLKERTDTAPLVPSGSDQETPDQPASTESSRADTEVFLLHFWSDRPKDETPTVIESFSCAYWPKESEGYISPLLHGRIFLTKDNFYFVGWSEKKVVLKWKDVTSVTKEKNLLGTIDNAIKLSCSVDGEDVSYFFGSFASREAAFQLMDRLSTVARALKELDGGSSDGKKESEASKLVPPDDTIKKMEVVLSKKLKNISISKYYEIAWSEGFEGIGRPFYGPWLEEAGSRNVTVEDWNVGSHTNAWCGGKYDRMRTVTFEFDRKTHLYIGPPVAKVRQVQYCKIENEDKCVVAMALDFDGIPYADAFGVEVRWVARRVDTSDILVEVGVFVNFKKSTMFASKIRSGTVQETKPIHSKLFDAIRAACANEDGVEPVDEDGEEEEETMPSGTEKSRGLFGMNFQSIFSSTKSLFQGSERSILIGCLCLFGGVKLYGLFYGGSSTASHEVKELVETVGKLREEIAALKETTKEMLTLLEGLKTDAQRS